MPSAQICHGCKQAPSTHKSDTFTHLQPDTQGYRNHLSPAAKWVHAAPPMRRAGQANKLCDHPSSRRANKRSRRYKHVRHPRRRTRRPCNNNSLHNDLRSSIGLAQRCRHDSFMRSRRTTQLISQSLKERHVECQQKNLFAGLSGKGAPEPMDRKSSNDIPTKMTATIRTCALHTTATTTYLLIYTYIYIHVKDLCQNYSNRCASNLRLMFRQTPNKTDTVTTPTAANRTNKTTKTK